MLIKDASDEVGGADWTLPYLHIEQPPINPLVSRLS
jgi:hypothetical protein